MDLLDEESHRLLLWAVRLYEVGHAPTRKELRRLSEPRRPAGLAVVTGLAGGDPDYREGAIASLLRRGLLEPVGDETVAPTEVGRRVVDAMGLHGDVLPMFEVLDVDLRSSDPLAFARVVGRIATLHRPMVVDPYCRRSELEYLAMHTSVTRVLISDRLDDDEVDDLIRFVRSVRRREHKLRLRMAGRDEIRDRCVVSSDRVLQIGGLPGTVGGGATVICEPRDLGEQTRSYYREVWKRAERLASYRPGRAASARVA
jgi:hypothetical protein